MFTEVSQLIRRSPDYPDSSSGVSVTQSAGSKLRTLQAPELAIERALDELANFRETPPTPTQLAQIVGHLLSTPETIECLKGRAKNYINSFCYAPLEKKETNQTGRSFSYAPAKTFTLETESLDKVVEGALSLSTHPDIGKAVLERVLLNPAVLGKLATIYEHAFMLKAQSIEEKQALVLDLCQKYANEDACLRFIRRTLPSEAHRVASDPVLYARAAIAHRWMCRTMHMDPYDTAAQVKCGNGTNPITEELRGVLEPDRPRHSLRQMISNLRADAAISCDTKLIIGESLFFQTPPDPATYDLSQYLLDCFDRGVRNIEIPADLLPFDPSKRLPAEIEVLELKRARELAKNLGQTITIHSPLVGPLHPKTGIRRPTGRPIR